MKGTLVSKIAVIVRQSKWSASLYGENSYCFPVHIEMDFVPGEKIDVIDCGNGTYFYGAWQKSYEDGIAEVIFDQAQWEPTQEVLNIYCPTVEEIRDLLQKSYKRQLTLT